MGVSIAPKRNLAKLVPVKKPVESYRTGGVSERTYYVNPDKIKPTKDKGSTVNNRKVIAMNLLAVMRQIRAPQGRAPQKFISDRIGTQREYRVINRQARRTTAGRSWD